MVESRAHNWKVVSSSLGPEEIVGVGVNVQRSLHLQYPDWGALEQNSTSKCHVWFNVSLAISFFVKLMQFLSEYCFYTIMKKAACISFIISYFSSTAKITT